MWMEIHSVSDSYCSTVNLQLPPKKLQGMSNNVGVTFSVGNTTPRFRSTSMEPDNENW